MTRTEAINEVAGQIADHIKPGLDAASIAAHLIDEKDAVDGSEIDLEVPGRYTRTGNPFNATTTMPDFDGADA